MRGAPLISGKSSRGADGPNIYYQYSNAARPEDNVE